MKQFYLALTVCLVCSLSVFSQSKRADLTGTFNVETAGTLADLLGDDKDNYTTLTITGDLNGDDIAVIRDMASDGYLEDLDIAGANIVEGGDAYYVSTLGEYYTANDTVGDYMFSGTYLTRLVLPETVVYIGEEALANNDDLKEVIIGSNTKAFGDMAFLYDWALEEITIPGSVEDLGDYTFYFCNVLKTVNLNEGLKRIGTNTFYFCTQLSNMTMPSTLEEIGQQAFFNCQSLPYINIPASVNSIGDGAFDRCYKLSAIDVEEDNPYYCDLDGVLYSKDMTVLYRAPINKEYGTYTIPESVVTIGNGAFDECAGLTAVVMSDNVTDIGTGVFADCENLVSVVLSSSLIEIPAGTFFGCHSLADIELPDGIQAIGSDAFMSCTSLTNIMIPEGVTIIDDAAFWGCSALESLSLPSTLESLGDAAFYGCTALTEIYCYAVEPPATGDSPFGEVNTDVCVLYVYETSVDAYKAAKYWQDFLIKTATGIQDVLATDGAPVYYDINGHILSAPQPGINIVKMPNGMTKKILVQ